MRRPFFRAAVRLGLAGYSGALATARLIRRRPRPIEEVGCDVLLTGAFQSNAWVAHHLGPLARSPRCARVTLVAAESALALDKVTVVSPPQWLVRIAGAAGARLLLFAAIALRTRPHFVGGFHLLFNGLAAALVAPLSGSRSLYFCVGGPMEVVGGGIWAENRLFGGLEAPSAAIERALARQFKSFDVIVTMGTSAATFVRARGARGKVHVIPGGLDLQEYGPSVEPPVTDLIFVGRLAPIKRLDLLLAAVGALKRRLPDIRLTLVGDGVLREPLEATVRELGLIDNVTFAGQRSDVADLLRRARVFVLTSDSEGVSLSLMEAFASGVPAVVSRVGDLADVVSDGVNGYLVNERSGQAFAERIEGLLSDEPRRRRFAGEARLAAERFGIDAMTCRWDEVLSS